MDRVKQINKDTVISIGLAGAFITCIVSIVWSFSGIATKVEAMENKDCPTRAEFNNLNDGVNYIKQNMVTEKNLQLILKQQ